MPVRKMTMKQWQTSIDAADPATANLMGDSPGGVAARLGCSRQAVHHLIKRGKLDAVAVYEGRKLAFYIIPEASVQAYRQHIMERISARLGKLSTSLTPPRHS